ASPALCLPVPVAGAVFHRWPLWTRLHPALPRPAPLERASDAVHDSSTRCWTLLLVRPFARDAATTASADFSLRFFFHRRPFRHEARSPQVRTHSFPAQPPDLRRFALTTRASRFHARSPCLAAPSIRFLFIGSQFRSALPLHGRSPFRSCASLRSLWSARGGTCTRKSAPMLGAHEKGPLAKRPRYCIFPLTRAYRRKPSFTLTVWLPAVRSTSAAMLAMPRFRLTPANTLLPFGVSFLSLPTFGVSEPHTLPMPA
ncbi:MAG: hypothetical protein JWP72_403, partial [Massilia sp.]|nr:hypothetical protein [Massilia sp.]